MAVILKKLINISSLVVGKTGSSSLSMEKWNNIVLKKQKKICKKWRGKYQLTKGSPSKETTSY